MYYLLLVLSTVTSSVKALFCKTVGNVGTDKRRIMQQNFFAFAAAFVFSLAFAGKNVARLFEISPFSLLLSLLFAFSVTFTQIAQVLAMGKGPASSVTLIYACGFLIPTAAGALFWNEKISIFQLLGVALLILSLVLVLGKHEQKTGKRLWIAFAVAAMLGSGLTAVLQKVHQLSEYADMFNVFLVYSMFFAMLFTGVAAFVFGLTARNGDETQKQGLVKTVVPPVCLGACVGLLNFLNLILAGNIPSVILFPVYNVGGMLLTAALSAIIFKDRPLLRQWIGFAVGIAAIIIIGLL